MKTKIKNEFQNSDLIFGNENQKRFSKIKNGFPKSKTKNKIENQKWRLNYDFEIK